MSENAGGDELLADPARLRSLQRVCISAEPDEAFDRFANLVRRLLDVPVALVSLVDDKRQFFPGQVGLAEPWAAKRETPLSHSFCQYVVLDGRMLVITDAREDARLHDNRAISDLGAIGYAGAPLTDADGRVLGSLCAIDTEPREWTPEELETLQDLAAACSSELRLRIERDFADEARERSESAHGQLAMLAELTERLAATLDVDESLRRLADAVTPRLADWCLISLVDAGGIARQVAAAHHDPAFATDVTRFAALMAGRYQTNSLLVSVLRTGHPVRHTGATAADVRSRNADEEIVTLAMRMGYSSHLTAPITAPVSQRVLGTITLINGAQRAAFTEDDERTTMDIGRRAGLAIDNSRLYREQRHVAEVLQQSLLTDLPDIPGVELHARYLPAQAGAAVGGDWYDAFAQPDGSVMLTVGDVSGHDIEAAATMGQLRNLVRGDAYGRDHEPGPLLTQLDRAMYGLHMPAAATAIVAKLRAVADGYTIGFANAGHPPPLLLRPDGEVEVWWTPAQPLLGLGRRGDRTTHRHDLAAGSTLLLYTDGLVEDRGQIIDDGIARLAETLRVHPVATGEDLCSRLLDAAGHRADDIALLLIRVGAP